MAGVEAERAHAAKVQDALYRIAELASAAHDMQEFYAAIHAVVGELMDARNLYIALYDDERQLISYPYWADELDKDWPDPSEWVEFSTREARGLTGYVLRTGEPQLVSKGRHKQLIGQGEIELVGVLTDDSSWLGVPLKAHGRTVGSLTVQSYTKDVQYTEQDKDLLAFVGQHIGAALSRARAIEETRQRNAELALINSVQEALAGELEMQAIYDLVGDKIDEIFDAQGVSISVLDETTRLMHWPYLIERGERLWPEPTPLSTGFTKHVLETLEPLVINEDLDTEAERYGSFLVAGEMPKSTLWVPLVSGGRATGIIALDNFDREHAFDDADVRLLTTLAGSLSAALENARLVHETRQRNAELALINSVQEALAGELEPQAIYDAVGDGIRDVFDAQAVGISMLDESTGLMHDNYFIERGERLYPEAWVPSGFSKHVLETREPLLLTENLRAESERYGSEVIEGSEEPKSVLFVPLAVGSRATGVISLQNVDRERAFSESDEQLLETLAGSLSVALENARLVHETRQRNAELALINSVQDALAGELELQAIYDAVGERIRDVFDAQVVDISLYDEVTGLIRFPYTIERGERLPDEPMELAGFRKHVMVSRETLLINENAAEAVEKYDNPVLSGQPAKSAIFVPLLVGARATGVISLQNIDREQAFSDSDQQLLETLAGSLSVALENARLVHETRQRNAELALINSVQDALAGELDEQAIYDAVGDKLQEVFDAQVVDIAMLDAAARRLHFRYTIERGVRLEDEPIEVIGFRKHVLETGQPLMISENGLEEAERYGNPPVISGEPAKTALFVPLIAGGRPTGVISLQNVDREHAYSESDQQLLETVAGSLSVALENARLVHETRQRNAELALINSVQEALAGELEMQAIYDVVGDKIQEIFDAQVVDIGNFDFAAGLIRYPYAIERGVRYPDEPTPIGRSLSTRTLLETKAPVVMNDVEAWFAERGESQTVTQGEPAQSMLAAPLISGDEVRGRITLQNLDRTNAFSDNDVRLLTTLAGSLSVALENARLVHETRQRNAELALINGVQEAIAGELDDQAIYDAVGDRIQEIFDAQVVDIRTLDEATGLMHYPYIIERGKRLQAEPSEPYGFEQHVLETREPIMVVENLAAEAERYGSDVLVGEAPQSILFVPLVSGGKATGVISLQNADREHAFSESDQQLLETLAGSLSVALENARLVHETRQRNAELALINGVQEAIAGELDDQAIYDAVGDRIQEIFDAQVVAITTLDEATGLVHYPYIIERGKRLEAEPGAQGGFEKHVMETREAILVTENIETEAERYGSAVVVGEMAKSVLFVPLVTGGKVTGTISLQNLDREHAFGESDQQLLETLAGSLSVALENARLVHETRQRNAELALINGVQDAIAGELDPQAIYDAVGDKIQEVFDTQAAMIIMLDEATGQAVVPYAIERGERQEWEPMEPTSFTRHVLETRESVLVNEDVSGEMARRGFEVRIVGDPPKSVLFVPLVAGGKATGVISLQNVDREHAFGESDQQLLETLAGSLSVALENARLVHETRQRNAELALINGVQEAIAGELDSQAIYDAVGDRIQEIFDAQVVSITTPDEPAGLLRYHYLIERGERLPLESSPIVGFSKHVIETQKPLLIAENMDAESERYGSPTVAGEDTKSALFVPLITGGRVVGVISLQNADREHAFGESDQQLLETLAGSLSVALENARLVHETRQRNAELALINGVQDAIAGELDDQAIYDAVGDRIQEIFDAQVVAIRTLDEATGLIHAPYIIERGERLHEEPQSPVGFSKLVMETRESVLIVENLAAEAERYGSPVLSGDPPKSVVFVPLVSGGKATGAISLQNVDREHAFGESDQQLLETLAGGLSVALENARLVHETRQRNAELALINSVQEAIAGELDDQAIYDAVGDRIQEIFDAQAVTISTLDEATGLQHWPYVIERGQRIETEPIPPGGFSLHVLETREPLLLVKNLDDERERYGSAVLAGGEAPKSVLFVPLVSGGKATGTISLQNVDREQAFDEDDQRLLMTLAGSLSVALENARLVHETRQRNAELALINSVQAAIAGELDPQAIYDVVGDKIRDVFDAQAVNIVTLDEATGLLHYPYMIERGERLDVESREPRGFSKHVLETRESLLIVENLEAERKRYGGGVVAGEPAKSVLFVPLVTGGKATGVISLQNIDREHAFDEDDRRLLTTLAGSLAVALENARLVEETQQRNAELALINSVQEAIAGELDPQAIYDHVGDRLREVFDAQAVDIGVHDEDAEILRFVYGVERGVHFPSLTVPVVGFRKHVLESREALYIAEDMDAALVEYGNPETVRGEPSHGSAVFQPLVVAGRAIGVISVQNLDREHAFSESDRRLLATIVGSVGVALENAQLIQETQQRVGELATVNSVGQALASQLDLDALIELVGEQVRETFDADIAYVALHNEAAGQIEFAYYYESGERRPEAPMEFGEGLTSDILRSREPLLLNRREQLVGEQPLGTPSLSYLGVPILVGKRAIGVISVQAIEEEGRFGEADVRLLSTLAANVGVAIHNARLFAEVERQREYSASLVEISPTAVIVMDRHEVVTEWNPAAGELFGYSPEEALGRDINDLVFGDGPREEGREITHEAMAKGRAQRLTRRIRKDGTPLDVELMLVPLVVEGIHSGFLGIYHDVTELQRARQEAEAATQAKSAFLATMSHEIRTPMNAVIGMTDLLLGTELTGEQREFAEVVHSSGDALLHVIDDILDYSKIEAGKLDLERQPFSLRDCLEGALDIVAPRAWEKEIELGCLIDERAPAGIVGDEARLRQVLLNLLSNAVKFTEAGEVVVLVDAEETGAGTFRVELAVRDTGIGIPPDRMDRLFTSFSQVDASTTRKFGGTGLGLAISKRLVELMGGTISVESKQQKGSTFRISLPVTEVDVPAKIALDDGLAHLSGKRILVVDDNATNREIVTRHARSWEMEPVAVEFPTDALDLIDKGEPFDIAVLDMMMPGMDGLALAGEIRSRRSAEELPLLLLTSLGHLPQAESSVFSAQLAKPFKASQLYNTLLRLLTPGGAAEEEVEPVTDGKRARSALRILLAEDNPMNQKVALRLLEQLGYRADVATNGLEAIEALERQPYDVVLMDVQMPELDGLDATRRICEQWPEESRPHIIAMTANALPEDREACFAAGMNDYVAKPIRAEELVAALKRAKPLSSNGTSRESSDLELDPAALAQLRDLGGDEFLGEVIDAFLGDAPELIATLRRSLDEQSAEELRRAAHTLKSNGATLGAAEFAELCRSLEQRAKEGELDGASELVDRIEQQYGPLRDALTALRSEPVS